VPKLLLFLSWIFLIFSTFCFQAPIAKNAANSKGVSGPALNGSLPRLQEADIRYKFLLNYLLTLVLVQFRR
jgi:hypothetical protein